MASTISASEGDNMASLLIEDLGRQLKQSSRISSMSSSIYDAAWVSMIIKTDPDSTRHWLFPQCFKYVLENQREDGGWEEYTTDIDGILNTMAALLSLKKHLHLKDCDGSSLPPNLDMRIAKGTSALERQLKSWKVESCLHVGFEILVPTLLTLLEENGPTFSFSGRRTLLDLNRRKLSKFQPEYLYSKNQTTLLHSLEAFIGKIDFHRIRHHAVSGSMMASPSSTAAYLMHSDPWDEVAEEYIRQAVLYGSGGGNGGVPSAFPSTTFELTWCLSTLLESGFSVKTLGSPALSEIGNFLEAHLSQGNGTVGFAPGLMSDADDTAKSLLSLALLGYPVDPAPMIKHFESSSCFLTYPNERNPSFSANCNILTTLLHMPAPEAYQTQIVKAATFICDTWDLEVVRDKWNLSTYYPMMLLAQCLIRIFRLQEMGQLLNLPSSLTKCRVPIVLTQIVIRLLREQRSDGSWGTGASYEVTSYALLGLKAASAVPWLSSISSKTHESIIRATNFLNENVARWRKAEYVWIEKVTYSSPTLSQVYCIAAVKAPGLPKVEEASMNQQALKIAKYASFFGSLPLFLETPEWLIKASIIESFLFQSKLEQTILNVFPSKEAAKHQYLSYIPITWIATKNNCQGFLDNDTLFDMMVISVLVYQADEYMEATVGPRFKHHLHFVREIITRLNLPDIGLKAAKNGNGTSHSTTMQEDLLEVERVLSAFINHIMTHPKVAKAPVSVRNDLKTAIVTFFLAHVTQIEDNATLSSHDVAASSNGNGYYSRTPKRSYFDWVHTTSAEHTSCPFAFILFSCLIDTAGTGVFKTTFQQYVAKDMCRHLSTMCRQYNDYGSVARDRAECNLNSLDFPEFNSRQFNDEVEVQEDRPNGLQQDTNGNGETLYSKLDAKGKEELMALAEYERKCLNYATNTLETLVPSDIMDKLRIYIDVTDLYGQIYVAKDLTSRIK